MTVDEYVELAKEELEAMQEKFTQGNKTDPENWPLELSEESWGEQELAQRFC